MKQTVFITGSSSGIGLETAKLFSKKGWNVIATMRNPEKRETEIHGVENIDLMHLDVTDINSIKLAVKTAIAKYGKIDALVNNAGYSAFGPFEASDPETVQRQFQTNVFGLMDVTREFIPHFKANKKGNIINIASIGGKMAMPLLSLYHGTKWAVEGFTESLLFELAPLGIKVKLIEPGPILTEFYGRSMDVMNNSDLPEYNKLLDKVNEGVTVGRSMWLPASGVAKKIYKASVSRSNKLRYPTGAMGMTTLRKILPDDWFIKIVKLIMT